MAKAKSKTTETGADGTGATVKSYAVLSPIKIGGKRFGAGTIELDPEAEETIELLAFGAITEDGGQADDAASEEA